MFTPVCLWHIVKMGFTSQFPTGWEVQTEMKSRTQASSDQLWAGVDKRRRASWQFNDLLSHSTYHSLHLQNNQSLKRFPFFKKCSCHHFLWMQLLNNEFSVFFQHEGQLYPRHNISQTVKAWLAMMCLITKYTHTLWKVSDSLVPWNMTWKVRKRDNLTNPSRTMMERTQWCS